MQSLKSMPLAPSPEPQPGAPPLRVLYYLAYYQRMAGANRVLFELITHLPSTVTPLVVLAGEGRAADAYREAGLEVEVLPPGKHLNQFGKAMLQWSTWKRAQVVMTELLPYTWQCLALMQAWQPDLVHVDGGRGTLMIGAAAKLLGCPVVGHMHGQLPFAGISHTYFEWVSSRIVTVCDAIQADLTPAGQAKATTIYNSVRSSLAPGPPSAWLKALKGEGKLVVSCFASVVPFKGHHHLLEAIAELNRRGWADRLVVLCVGDIEAEYQHHANWLMQRLHALNLHNVTFTGWQSNPFGFYQLADIEVLPSVSSERLDYGNFETAARSGRAAVAGLPQAVQPTNCVVEIGGNEGFPTTHLEAMTFGLPIVGTDIAGVREQVEHGVNGLVVPPSAPLALADALETLLKDGELRSRMGQAGRDRVQRDFSTEAHVTAMVNLYQDLLPHPKPALIPTP